MDKKLNTILKNSDRCPHCGETEFIVTRGDKYDIDAYGNETKIEGGGVLIASCCNCNATLYVPWVEDENFRVREEKRNKTQKMLVSRGYKVAKPKDVIEKYGIESFADLEDIITFSLFAVTGYEDYEEGFDCIVQEMYDIPCVFVECIDSAMNHIAEDEVVSTEKWEEYRKRGVELSRQPCDNLKFVYGISPTLFAGTEEEPPRIFIDGVECDEDPRGYDPMDLQIAIVRAIDKYNESKEE